jgi:hypothetical protein
LISYERFQNVAEAKEELEKRTIESAKVLRKGVVKNQLNEAVGEKILVVTTNADQSGNRYSLIWTRGGRITQIDSDSLQAIESYEKDRKL